MERLAAFDAEMRHLAALSVFAGWSGRLSDAELAAPPFGDAAPAEVALMADAAREEAEVRASQRPCRGGASG